MEWRNKNDRMADDGRKMEKLGNRVMMRDCLKKRLKKTKI